MSSSSTVTAPDVTSVLIDTNLKMHDVLDRVLSIWDSKHCSEFRKHKYESRQQVANKKRERI